MVQILRTPAEHRLASAMRCMVNALKAIEWEGDRRAAAIWLNRAKHSLEPVDKEECMDPSMKARMAVAIVMMDEALQLIEHHPRRFAGKSKRHKIGAAKESAIRMS